MIYINNYFVYHLHSDLSTAVTNVDSVSKFKDYVNKAKDLGMSALAFTEHGSVYEWYHKKQAIEAAGMKYVHGIETYITESLDEKIRDNYHCILLAKNKEGFYEINKLSSKAFNRDDGHFYYVPRITIDELLNTSDNIIVTSACLGGILNNGSKELQKKYLEFFLNNKDRCFLEIQHHNVDEQKIYNKKLWQLSNKTGLKLVAATDTHALNKLYLEGRSILQKAKNIHFDEEDGWDLTFKSYDELVESFELQNCLPKEVYLEAIENTNLIADMVEEFEVGISYKYPKLYDNSEEVFLYKIAEGIKDRGIDKKPNYEEYKQRIREEFKVYKDNGAIDFMLLEEDYKRVMRSKNIYPNYSRGSVSGSIIAYLLHITDIDSIEHKLIFSRFMNSERVSLADIDSDWYSEDRDKIKEYLYNKHGLYCSEIVTYNTIQLNGAIRDIGRALEIPLSEVNSICKKAEKDLENTKKEYPELFKWVDVVQGVITSVGSHAAGFIVSPIPLDEHMGLSTTSSTKYPVSQLNMKEVEAQNYLKLDVLGLDNIGLINKTCELAGIERLTPDNTPADDIDVWNSIREDTTCIFQWESNSASQYLKQLFSDETIAKIKEINPNFSYMDLLSIGNGAIRPAGASYRNQLSKGEFHDNGHPALNEFLKPTLGFLTFQEEIISFLHDFCGYTMGEADIVRRHFSKKIGTEEDIPKIKAGFIKTMKERYNIPEEESEKIVVDFLRVINNASDYLFSLNHALPYSWTGYICGYLRYYYPLEFLTTALNIFANDEAKSLKIIAYAEKIGIKINPIKFRYSLQDYVMDKEENAIYKGMASIKYLNKAMSRELYRLRDIKFEDFYSLLQTLENTSVDSRQLEILIKLDFFSEFGNPNQLLKKVEIFNSYYGRKQFNKDMFFQVQIEKLEPYIEKITEKQIYISADNTLEIMRLFDDTDNIKTTLQQRIQYQQEHQGYVTIRIPELSDEYKLVQDIDGKYKNKHVTLYTLSTGEKEIIKVKGHTLEDNPISKGDIIKVNLISSERKWSKDENGKWIRIDEYENILKSYQKLKS